MYSFAKGYVASSYSVILQLQHTEQEVCFSTLNESPPDINESVFVSWKTKNGKPRSFKGKLWVDRSAIEPVNLWKRNSKYKARYNRDSFGFEVEEFIIEKIIWSGVRVEKATPFEDELLGIDFWVFLKFGNLWKWIPVDCTVRLDVDVHKGEKFNKGFKCNVPVVRVNPVDFDTNSLFTFQNFIFNLNQVISHFVVCGQDIISREEAKKQEEEWNG